MLVPDFSSRVRFSGMDLSNIFFQRRARRRWSDYLDVSDRSRTGRRPRAELIADPDPAAAPSTA